MAHMQTERFDVAIVGAGIFGLSIAYRAIKSGLRVAVLEAETVGAGASGGVLGALMPHMPARWNPKKEFQFQALLGLQGHIQTLEAESGLICGYRRCGRILPLTTKDKLDHHLERSREARERWQSARTGFTYTVEKTGSRAQWISPAAAPFGVVYETLAARVSPRAYLGVLAQIVRARGTLFEKTSFLDYDTATGALELGAPAPPLTAATLVVANGKAAFDVIERFTGQCAGRGEKGQAIVLDGKGLEHHPAIYCDGLYVVPHDNGTVAVGSTADRTFEDSLVCPMKSAELVERATRFCPSLSGRAVLDAWSGIRPRCNKRDPLIGKIPGHETVYVATGGYKISFGIAHMIADCLVSELTGEQPGQVLPDTFKPDNHLGASLLADDGKVTGTSHSGTDR